jgi:hypothetical protein
MKTPALDMGEVLALWNALPKICWWSMFLRGDFNLLQNTETSFNTCSELVKVSAPIFLIQGDLDRHVQFSKCHVLGAVYSAGLDLLDQDVLNS